MKYAIKAEDGSYLRHPGDSLSSRYDDVGYSCWNIYSADLFSSIEEASFAFHEEGKFSKQLAKIAIIELQLSSNCRLFCYICLSNPFTNENS